MQKIALVLVVVDAAQELCLPCAHTCPGIMTGRDPVSAERLCVIEKGMEFDFLVAEYVWIGCSPGTVLIQKMLKHTVPVLTGKIDAV